MIKQYRKKPVIVEVLHVKSSSVDFIQELISFCSDKLSFSQNSPAAFSVALKTASDPKREICVSEYIIKYSDGNLDVLDSYNFENNFEEIK